MNILKQPAKPVPTVAKLAAKASGEPGWMWRRWVLFPNIIASFIMLFYLSFANDTTVNQIMVQGYFWNIILSVMIYTGFATAQDITAIIATRSGLPYKPEQQPDPNVAVTGDANAPQKQEQVDPKPVVMEE